MSPAAPVISSFILVELKPAGTEQQGKMSFGALAAYFRQKKGAFAPLSHPHYIRTIALIFAPAPQLLELAALPLQLQLVLLYLLTLDRRLVIPRL